MQYIGQRGGGASGSVLAYVDYFAAAPGNGWKPLGDVTEFDIFKLRRSGAIAANPRVFVSNQRSANLPLVAAGNPNSLPNRQLACIGPEYVYSKTGNVDGGNHTFTIAPLNNAVVNNVGALMRATLGGVTITGISFANGELFIFSGTAPGNGAIQYGVPPVPTFLQGGTYVNASYMSVTSFATPNGAALGYNQLTYGLGKYVSWQRGGGVPMYYSTNKSTWTACAVAGLNADGGAAGATIADLKYDPVQQLFIGISVYGEIVTSPDGITFTKTYTRAAGGTTHGLTNLAVTKDGVILAAGTGAGAGQYYTAPSIAGPFSLATLSAAGYTFPTRVIECAYTAGVSFFALNGVISTDAIFVFSRDERLTYEVTVAGDSLLDTAGVLAAAGVAVLLNSDINYAGVNASGFVGRIGTDWANIVAAPIHNDFFTLPSGAGTKLEPYIKVA